MKLLNSRNSIVGLLCLLSFTLGGFVAGKADEEGALRPAPHQLFWFMLPTGTNTGF